MGKWLIFNVLLPSLGSREGMGVSSFEPEKGRDIHIYHAILSAKILLYMSLCHTYHFGTKFENMQISE
jgi:hypothetical protein